MLSSATVPLPKLRNNLLGYLSVSSFKKRSALLLLNNLFYFLFLENFDFDFGFDFDFDFDLERDDMIMIIICKYKNTAYSNNNLAT